MAGKSRPALDTMVSLFERLIVIQFRVTRLVSQTGHGSTPNHGTGKAWFILKLNPLGKSELRYFPLESLLLVNHLTI